MLFEAGRLTVVRSFSGAVILYLVMLSIFVFS